MNLFQLDKQNEKSLPFVIHIISFMMINGDIPRYIDSNKAKFYDVNKGRLYPIIKAVFKQMSLEECTYVCIQFLDCESVNYNDELKLCELCNDVYDEYEAVENPLESWYNYATPLKQNGGYTHWSKWSSETKVCVEASHTRYRTCSNPSPDFGGIDCFGDPIERKIFTKFPCSSKETMFGICYSKENPKGHFKANYTGVIKEVVLYHKNGSTRCNNNLWMIDAYWGCVYGNDNCATDRCFSIHIIDEDSGEILVPFGITKSSYGSYNIPHYIEANSKSITLKVKQGGFVVTRGTHYYVTLGYYKYYNYALTFGHGTHCIHVEFIYSSI